MFKEGPIEGVEIKKLKRYADERGWLMELFRADEVATVYHPAMTCASLTRPGIARGPHEHIDQADYFCFAGPSDFKVFLWDNRPESPTYKFRIRLIAQEADPTQVHAR